MEKMLFRRYYNNWSICFSATMKRFVLNFEEFKSKVVHNILLIVKPIKNGKIWIQLFYQLAEI